MSIRLKQSKFTRLVALFILAGKEKGYEFSFATAYRNKAMNAVIGGNPNSLHMKRLAIDLNIFYDGKWITNTSNKNHLAYTKLLNEIGSLWESLDEDNAWGGRFGESEPGKGDGWDPGHFSSAHGGVR